MDNKAVACIAGGIIYAGTSQNLIKRKTACQTVGCSKALVACCHGLSRYAFSKCRTVDLRNISPGHT